MKKILSLLSVLTISGSAVPTTIAASFYKKDEQNLENLQRVKRGNDKKKKQTTKQTTSNDVDSNIPPTSITNNNKCGGRSRYGINKCLKPNTAINDSDDGSKLTTKIAKDRILNEINENSSGIFKNGKKKNKYKNFITSSIDYFKETNNIVEETRNPYTNRPIYKIKKHDIEDSYKIIPLNIDDNKIDLILNKSNLYVDGIITYDDDENKTIVYFPDSNLDKNYKSLEKEKDKHAFFSKILKFEIKSNKEKETMIKKLYFDSNYQTLTTGDTNIKISKKNIESAIINLSKINDRKIEEMKQNKATENQIKKDFLRIIFATAESTRFFSIRKDLNKILISSNDYEINWQDYKDTLTSWDKNSQKYYKMKDSAELQLKITIKEKEEIYNIAVLAVKDDEKIRQDNDDRKSG